VRDPIIQSVMCVGHSDTLASPLDYQLVCSTWVRTTICTCTLVSVEQLVRITFPTGSNICVITGKRNMSNVDMA
jgi:hypothetical protein